MAIKITEREVVAGLAEELNHVLQEGGMPFDRATVESRAASGYPDLTLWTNYATKQAFAFWEFKSPGLQEDLSKLPAKAQSLGTSYVVVWNFQNGTLYRFGGGTLEPLKSYPIPVLSSLEDWAVIPSRQAVIEQARRILYDLARLARGESLTPFVPDKFYFINILREAIRSLLPVLRQHLLQAMKERATRDRVYAWAVKQGYSLALENLDELLARHWAYSIAVRTLFYFTVRRYRPGLPDLRPLAEGGPTAAALLQEAFAKAQAVDWQAVFEPSPLDRLGLPQAAEPTLRRLLEDFHRYDFSQLKEDVIGQVMEGLIPEEERHALGQYFTPEDLVDFIIGFVAVREDAAYLDPTCGSGTFLNRLYSRLRWLSAYRVEHAQLLERLWGVDLAHFPAELATINLFRQRVQDITNFPRIAVRDFFQVRPGEVFSFPPLRAGEEKYAHIDVQMPLFDGIIGNFPYIRQELIERQNKGYKKQIVSAIAEEWLWRDPDLFTLKGVPREELGVVERKPPEERRAWVRDQVNAGRIDLRLSGQADIYAYLFYHTASFLKEGGRIGIVTSNAWLDVAYGAELKRFFLRHFKIIAIVASWAEPWFEDAAVNTAFTILERCEDPNERAQHVVRFVKVKKPLADLLPRDLAVNEDQRWRKVDALVREIEHAAPEGAAGQAVEGIHTVEKESFRIRLVPQQALEAELEAKGPTAKWGLYIRAPQVYFDLLREAGDKLVPLSQVAEVRRGYTTGINDFFYLEPLGPGQTPGTLRVKNARGWVGEIEEDFLKPTLLSLKEVISLALSGKEAKSLLFVCPYGRKDLQTKGYYGALGYVQWGDEQRTAGRGRVGTYGVPFPLVSTVQSHRPEWFNLPIRKPGQIISNRFIGERFGFPINPRLVISDTFFEISFTGEEELYAALLNCTLSFLLVELTGRQTWAQGVLYLYGPELRELLVPSISYMPTHLRERILQTFGRLNRRSVKPIAQEIRQKDRQALDTAVLEALGLDPGTYLPLIYAGLVEMVKERLALPKLRAGRQKGGRRQSLEQVKDHITQELLPNGLRPITAFLPSPKPKMQALPITGRPVSWQPFITQFTLGDEKGQPVGTLQGTEAQARYAIYAAVPGAYVVEVPEDALSAGKAVQAYEGYLRRTAQDLFERALAATRNHREAERVVREILASLGLPPLAVEAALKG